MRARFINSEIETMSRRFVRSAVLAQGEIFPAGARGSDLGRSVDDLTQLGPHSTGRPAGRPTRPGAAGIKPR